MPFIYNTRLVNDIHIIQLIGELKIFDLADYTAFFDEFLEQGRLRIIINLSKISYIDSTAIGLLVNIKRNVVEKGGKLVICEVHPDVLNVFKITGVDNFIDIYSSEAEALGAF